MQTAISSTLSPSDLPFTVRQRMEHIERCLFWKGELQRADLIEIFGINPAQAAADFRDYMLVAAGNMDYNKSRKRYLPLPGFAPKFIEPTSLDEFVGIESSAIPTEPWPLPRRLASSETLQAVVKAIRCHEALEVRYQSMSDPKSSWRWLSPHAFASDGERWHVRAFCHKREEFRDFVLGRCIATRNSRPSEVSADQDTDWHTFLTVMVIPNPELSDDQRVAIAAEYNMPRNHQTKLRIRKSMLFYLKARYSPQPQSVAAAHQLVVVERKSEEKQDRVSK
jgi:hypothetical protein